MAVVDELHEENVAEKGEGIRSDVSAALDALKLKFWQQWYPAHRKDVILSIPLRPVRVNDARKLLEMIFGEAPDR
jgi:hypothetical protein